MVECGDVVFGVEGVDMIIRLCTAEGTWWIEETSIGISEEAKCFGGLM